VEWAIGNGVSVMALMYLWGKADRRIMSA
jgi:hypothetical protein